LSQAPSIHHHPLDCLERKPWLVLRSIQSLQPRSSYASGLYSTQCPRSRIQIHLAETDEEAEVDGCTLFFPKFMLGPAFIEHMEARACCELAADQGRRWPRTYAYFANMGGFLLSFSQSPACERGQSAPHTEIEQSGLSQPRCDAEGAYAGRRLTLNGRQILELTKCPNVQFSRPIGRSVDGASLSGLDSDISS